MGEGECAFQRKVAVVEICCLLAPSKNPEYYTAGKRASSLSEFFGSTPGNHSLFKEMLQKCTLGALYFTGSDHWPLNSLSPNSDQCQFTPNSIHTQSRDEVMRINKMITQEKMPRFVIKFSQLIL